MKKRIGCFLFVLVLLTDSLPAALEFNLIPSVQSGPVGIEITFSGTLKNTSSTDDLFLNDLQFSLNGAATTALVPNGSVFFANVPGILLPNETYSGPIFAVTVKSSPAQADYTGSVTIRGGVDIFALTDLLSTNFQSSSDVPIVTIGGNHLQMQFHRTNGASDIVYVVEGCSDLMSGQWSSVLTRGHDGMWTVNQSGASVLESGSGDLVLVTATDSVPVTDPDTSQPTAKRFLRLRMIR